MAEKVFLKVYCDGGARGNPGPAGIGFLVKNKEGKTLKKFGKYIGETTNNVAEYTAVIEALKWLGKNLSPSQDYQIDFFLDSQLLVNQLTGRWRIKDQKLRRLAVLAKNLEKRISGPVFYHHIPRRENAEIDDIVGLFRTSRACGKL